MTGNLPTARDIHEVKVTDTPDGEGFRKITLEWRDAIDMPKSQTFRGMTAHRVHGDLAACTAASEAARAGYMLGLIRLFGIMEEKGLTLA